MEDSRSTALGTLQQFVSGWLSGDYGTVAALCSPTVRWWSPLGETVEGPDDAWAELGRVLTVTGAPVYVAGLIVSEDGSTGVVELRSRPAQEGGATALVTSVVALTEGQVADGRTYLDLAPSGDRTGGTA